MAGSMNNGRPPVERICPECRAAQTLDAHYCATCGAPLERLVPIRATQWLPAVVRQQLRHPLVRGAAMGAMAVVVEVAVVLIRRALSRQVAQQLIPAAMCRCLLPAMHRPHQRPRGALR
jgi:predicted amidophosphoribosyltransferase